MIKKQKNLTKTLENNQKTLIVVGPMKFPWSSLKSFLRSPNISLVFIDGGLSHLYKFKAKTPHLLKNYVSMGDGDSSNKVMTVKKSKQNVSDLAFLLSRIKGKMDLNKFVFVGFLGGRIDHQLFNLGELAQYLKKFPKHNAPLIQLDDKIVFVGAGVYHVQIEGTFSLAAFENNRIKITGDCQYEATSWISLTTLSSRGVSNIGFGDIKIETQKPLAIIRC